MRAYLLVNFGGPRDSEEIAPFLTELLTDRDVIRTRFPDWLHHWFFGRIARKRALRIQADYERIGYSPIHRDTETLRDLLEKKLEAPVFAFHRYLPNTHAESLRKIEECAQEEICTLPLFPQFCFGTTGSVARFFKKRLSPKTLLKLRWIRSYPSHPSFIEAWQNHIRRFLEEQRLAEKETAFLFSAHGVPRDFIEEGDPYETECIRSYEEILARFPKAVGRLSFQSKFGKGEWLRPYTDDECKRVSSWIQGKKQVVVVPITFTSDHIETLFEIEELYLPLIRQTHPAFRCPALNCAPDWVAALAEIAQTEGSLWPNDALVRR